MRMKYLYCTLSLLVLLGTVHGNIPPATECIARAWVRAPDLTPDTIVRGDARVKISAECPAVETVSLGLRLKERSFAKALRSAEDKKFMRPAHPLIIDAHGTSPWDFPPSRFSNHSDEVRFQEILANKDLWLVREEERIVFETMQVMDMGEETAQDRVVVQDFAVFIPSTNFPLALDYLNSGFIISLDSMIEIVDMESMYEYFIRVLFANGTTKDVSAGFTGFQPLYDPADTPRWPSSGTAELEQRRIGVPGNASVTNYTARVSGLVFTEGSEDQAVTVVITRTGPARSFTAPLAVRACVYPTFSSKWAVEYDMPGLLPMHRPDYVLRSTLEDVQDAKRNSRRPLCYNPQLGTVSVMMPNSTSEDIQSHNIVTTTSQAVTIPIEINRRQVTNFETYYQTLANSLQIRLATPRTEDEAVDPDDPSAKVPEAWGPDFPDDDEPWVPWEKATPKMPPFESWATYTGNVPAVIRPTGHAAPSHCLRPGMGMEGQEVLLSETSCEQHSLVHYLHEGARGPTFVDSNDIHQLLSMNPGERELRAPILEPVVSSSPEGEELIYRYYLRRNPRKPLIYVGETWARKVADREEHEVSPTSTRN